MAEETYITIIGNLTADPEIRFTPGGLAVANFTVAQTPRVFDRATNSWRDGEALFMRCNIWREAAENVAESLVRGARVIVTGKLVSRTWETREGEKRTTVELQVVEMGPSLRFATAQVTKITRNGGSAPSAPAASDDPWQNANAAQSPALAGVGARAQDDEPPF
ncbi:single-stranded DNA-binding protein [Nocardia sp. alder85J]|uniref:single-stranded DNA-binding protein n=1 Tax=Nocardia sp. alder85J TaxID=2862949 RepID=UPI001CD55FF8|nr:single-stranded DNA-binding protein [Nocardia sp. alder85J]MCX4094557.1 single-stranded DNA-binding protein [Nocardia sp. alder85J]